jgi:hypothetical protein
MPQPEAPRDVVEAWLKVNGARIGNPVKFHRYDSPSQTLVVWFQTPEFLIEICVWDHACCLNIEAMNVKTEKADFYVEGPCKHISDLTERLNAFLSWYESSKKSS